MWGLTQLSGQGLNVLPKEGKEVTLLFVNHHFFVYMFTTSTTSMY